MGTIDQARLRNKGVKVCRKWKTEMVAEERKWVGTAAFGIMGAG